MRNVCNLGPCDTLDLEQRSVMVQWSEARSCLVCEVKIDRIRKVREVIGGRFVYWVRA